MKVEDQRALELLKHARELLGQVTLNDIRQDIRWLSHLRFSVGYLDDAIVQLEKFIKKESL